MADFAEHQAQRECAAESEAFGGESEGPRGAPFANRWSWVTDTAVDICLRGPQAKTACRYPSATESAARVPFTFPYAARAAGQPRRCLAPPLGVGMSPTGHLNVPNWGLKSTQ